MNCLRLSKMAALMVLCAACGFVSLTARAAQTERHPLEIAAGEAEEEKELFEAIARSYRDSLMPVELVEPAWKARIYASQPQKRIVARLIRLAELVAYDDPNVYVALVDADGKAIEKKTLSRPAADAGHTGDWGPQDVIFDASQLAPGDYFVEFYAPWDSHNREGSLRAFKQVLKVTVLPPAKHEVYFDAEGVCMHDGKPFFPIGLFHVGDNLVMLNEDLKKMGMPPMTVEDVLRRVSQNGFNTAVVCGDDITEPLKLAPKYGLKVVQAAWKGDDPLRQWVMQHREDPSLLAWYITDEPLAIRRMQAAARQYLIVRRADLYHPVTISQAAANLWETGHMADDLMFFWIYPKISNRWYAKMPWWKDDHKSFLRLITRYCEQVYDTLEPKEPYWFISQAYEGGSAIRPTAAEVRHQTYQAIVAGARGVFGYSYLSGEVTDGLHWWIEKDPQLWEGYGKLNAELHELYPMLIAHGGKIGQRMPGSPDIRYFEREHDGRLYVIAVNIDERVQDLEISMPGRCRAKVKWEDRTLAIEGRLVDRLEPLAVRVYEVQ